MYSAAQVTVVTPESSYNDQRRGLYEEVGCSEVFLWLVVSWLKRVACVAEDLRFLITLLLLVTLQLLRIGLLFFSE